MSVGSGGSAPLPGFLYMVQISYSGVARGGQVGAQALEEHQHTFCSHLKTLFKQKFRPKYA